MLYYVTAALLHRSDTKAPLFEQVLHYVTAAALIKKYWQLDKFITANTFILAIIKMFFLTFRVKIINIQKICPCTPSGHMQNIRAASARSSRNMARTKSVMYLMYVRTNRRPRAGRQYLSSHTGER